MSRESKAVARILQQALRSGRGRVAPPLLVLGCLLLAGYLLAEPWLERSWGFDLPGVHAYEGAVVTAAPNASPKPPSQPTARSPQPGARVEHSSTTAQATTTVESLIRSDRDAYTSPAGLRYSRGTQHGHHLRHLMAHAQDEPDRPGQHGVFDSHDVLEVVGLVDQAYLQALSGRGTRQRTEGDRQVYTVDMGRRVGYVGGQSGNRRGRPAAQHVQLVLVGKKIITAFPLIP